jgi:hypothetical protein
VRVNRRREHLGIFLLVIAICLGVAMVVLVKESGRASALVAREDMARDTLEKVREAQLAFHRQEGRYGWIDELEAAGLLDGLDVGSDEDPPRRWVRSDGYRVDALLPHALLATDVVAIVRRGDGKTVDPELSTRHFSLVARPIEPRRSGHRIWYVDERNELYLNEGVIDDEGAARNLLPSTQVRGSATLATADYLLWQKVEDISPDGD